MQVFSIFGHKKFNGRTLWSNIHYVLPFSFPFCANSGHFGFFLRKVGTNCRFSAQNFSILRKLSRSTKNFSNLFYSFPRNIKNFCKLFYSALFFFQLLIHGVYIKTFPNDYLVTLHFVINVYISMFSLYNIVEGICKILYITVNCAKNVHS